MKRSIFTTTVVAALLAGVAAFAGTTSGVISAIDNGAETVTLENGQSFTANDGSFRQPMLNGYLVGDHVTIVWLDEGGQHVIRSMAPDTNTGVSGTVANIDLAAQTVTLDGGTVYHFRETGNEMVDLSGFSAGDHVTIHATNEGGTQVGRAIAPDFSAEVTGEVQSADQGAQTLTLADGTVYHFDTSDGIDVTGYRPGDMVMIVASMVGNQHHARAISPAS